MTSSSSLYGTVTTQSTNSGNSTSLYGEAGTPIPDSSGNVVVRGDLLVLSGNILTTANTGNIFPANATTINLGLAATAVNIGANTGTTTINNALVADSGDFGNITIGVTDAQTIDTTAGELRLSSVSNAIKLVGTTSIYTDNTSTFNLLNQPTSVFAFRNATQLELGEDTGTTGINNNLRIDGTDITIAQGTTFGYSEANNRLNRPNFQSTTGNSSGVRAIGPNATSSALSTISAFSSSDLDNGSFINIQARNGGTNPLRVQTGEYTGGILGASSGLAFVDNATVYATVNPAGPTIGSDLTTKTYVDGLVAGGVTSITGTADQVIVSTPTGAVTLSLPQSIATTSNVTFADVIVGDDLTVQGNNVNLAQATVIGYNENNDRANRPAVQSTSGNNSGFRVLAPNATTSASSNLTAFGSNDINNGEFLSIQATGSPTAPFNIRTGKYTAGVLGASGEEINFIDNTTTYASINPAGPTNSTDLTTKAYVDALPANITYTIDASTTTGGANFNLVGSDSTTDTVKFANGTNVTVSRTDANTITIAATDTNTTYDYNATSTTGGANLNLVGSDSTTDTVKLSNGTGVTVSQVSGTEVSVAIGQAVGTTDNVQFNGVTTNSITTGTVNANGGVNFVNTGPGGGTYATVNQFGPTNIDDLTTVGYVNSVLPTVVTYDLAAASTTGGANLTLTGSNSTTDTVKLSNGGHITATYSSATEVTLGSDATDANTANAIVSRDASGNFSASGATLGNISVGVASDQTISTTSGDLILDSASGVLQLADPNISSTVAQTWTVVDNNASALSIDASGKTGLLKLDTTNSAERVVTSGNLTVNGSQILVTQNTTYVPVVSALTTVTGQNGVAISSSTGGANGYGANVSIRYHTGDTTAAGNNAASVVTSSATGTSSAPGGVTSNLVLGAYNFDGYTAGTSNNYASQIATINQGGGTTALTPLQAQSYARQNFTNSTTVTTAVTGASGTGTTATLTFTTQNTAPYAVGQSVTIAGMTPSGYNGTYTITAATTSSISYANATTGFTSGGTIAAQNTVTAAGTGYRIRGFANSTAMTAGNRFNFMDLTASAATFKSDAYTFANSVITGSTLTATNYMTLGATTGSINQDTFTLKNTAGTTTYATLNSTSATLNGDTVNLRNTAGTTTYGNFTSTGTTITGAGLHTFTRTTVGTPGVAEQRPALNIQLTRSDQAVPNDADGTSFRSRVAGSNGTFYTISDINSVYKTGGDVQFNVNLANGDQTTGSFSGLPILSSSITQTRIKAGTASGTPGASTVSDVAIFTPTTNTLRSNALALTDYAGVALVGNNINYNRVYGQWQNLNTVTPAGSNTAYAFALPTVDFNNIATVGSTSRIIPGAAGMYKLQFSAQVQNDDSASEHFAYFWWRKNGTDVPGSMGTVGVPKAAGAGNALTIAGWDNMISSANATDYWELMYAVDDSAHVDFPAFGTTAFGPATSSLFVTLVPIGA